MPCGCKKGSGVSFRGGGMGIHGGGVRKRKRRKRKKRGSGLIGADPRTWAPRGSGLVSTILGRLGRPRQTNRYAGLGGGGGRRAGFGRKRGSGMGFSGAGMAFHGAGLRTGRLFLRRGTGRRMI